MRDKREQTRNKKLEIKYKRHDMREKNLEIRDET